MKEVGRMKTKELNKGEINLFGCGSDCSFPCFSGNGIGGKK